MNRINKAMKKRIDFLLFVLIVTLVIIIGMSHSSKYHLEIPTAEYIEKNGYPTNRNGETYVPQIKDTLDSPDLILAENSDGLKGYVKRAEMDYTPRSTEEAEEINLSSGKTTYNMYLQDGKTIIGKFSVDNPSLIIKMEKITTKENNE